jgi:pimeloyl-ACP methyl ester carboxylesterase
LKPATGPEDAIHRLELPDSAVTVNVPTTVLWGEADVALLPCLLEGLERWVPDLQIERVPGATHWLAHEQPDRVVAAIAATLAKS